MPIAESFSSSSRRAERGDDRHPGAAAHLVEGHGHPERRHRGVTLAGVGGEAVLEHDAPRLVDAHELPPAVGLVAVRAGHEVVRLSTDDEVVVDEGGRPGRRSPPLLELTRVGPHLPHALGRGRELGGQGERQGFGVLDDVDDGHRWSPRECWVTGGRWLVRMVQMARRFGQQGADAVDPAPPDLLVVVQQLGGSPYGLDVPAHEPLPSAGALGDEAALVPGRRRASAPRRSSSSSGGPTRTRTPRRAGRGRRCRDGSRRRGPRRRGPRPSEQFDNHLVVC